MAGQATELFNLASSFDPLSAYRQGQMTSQKFDIQQAILDEQTKEIEADKAQESTLAQKAQAPGAVPLAKMANQMIPDAKLYNDDGTLTTAGQMNDMLTNATKLTKQGKMMGMQAALIEDPYQRTQAMAESRRMMQAGQTDAIKARELKDKVRDDTIYALATANNQTQWDAALKAYEATGLPLPKETPTQYTPENAKKVTAFAPAALQSKISNDILKREQEARLVKSAELRDQKMAASLRDGNSGKGGMRSAIIEQRQDTLAVNATEFVRTLQNITDLPAESTSGIFGGKTAGSLFTAPVEAATNTLTSDSVQRYNSEMGGLGNHLSWMVSGGLSPSVSVQEKFDSILKIKEGDSPAAVLTKLARARQEAENVLAVKMKSRLMSPEMKEMLKGLDDDLKKTIPFTVSDVNKWANAKDKKETFGQFMGKTIGGETVTVGGKTYTRPANMSDQDWADYKKSVEESK